MLGCLLNLADTVCYPVRVIHMVPCDLRHAENDIHRRPHIMGHIGQKFTLRAVRLLCPFMCQFDCRLQLLLLALRRVNILYRQHDHLRHPGLLLSKQKLHTHPAVIFPS